MTYAEKMHSNEGYVRMPLCVLLKTQSINTFSRTRWKLIFYSKKRVSFQHLFSWCPTKNRFAYHLTGCFNGWATCPLIRNTVFDSQFGALMLRWCIVSYPWLTSMWKRGQLLGKIIPSSRCCYPTTGLVVQIPTNWKKCIILHTFVSTIKKDVMDIPNCGYG